ncbi:MAG: carbon-nitrogen hydrolase family protein [Armatimonadota bacterium]|nr:carbon-nitrogen hydrolase family protein [Armatimonadota bacterium]MDR5675796.1 carbon-nitrogen hydrolase family protein [Armatimonadota bacterium]MDR5688626.1 carbon-nitrogen hydrolase family protein [Armatimonadota bacterium]MDR7386098.1 carbon-nitrogen hydrolase family protein [Armatimonadota bacterium]MDR7389913.1 carbon-nitrogen hydrolase family protein [Armatimonadota bacterium]
MGFRVAVVQPVSHPPDRAEANLPEALRWIERGAAEGAQFVCFPESYPGPWRMPASFDPRPAVREAAARHRVHVVFGTLEPLEGETKAAYTLVCLAYPDGRPVAEYRRTHPRGPWIYLGGRRWDFRYVPGDALPVFETEFGKVGLAMCSEVYVPEVARALALQGAELLFLPAGVDKKRLWSTWRTLIWARAIENLAVVVTTQNLFTPEERGLAMLAGPEEILLESTAAGMFVVDVSLERVRYLRATRDELGAWEHCATKQGLLSDQWLRPELYEGMYRTLRAKVAAQRE